MIITRFAPSPTGFLHIGNLRTAIFNFLATRKEGGKFILRLDDTDSSRSKKEFVDQVKEDLNWLGICWDQEFSQSDHIKRYDSIKKELVEMGRVYECFETPAELDLKRKKLLSMGRPPVYDRASLQLSEKEKEKLRSEKPGYWRFKLNNEVVEWRDSILGNQSINPSSVSDPVIVKADGQYLYTLASVVDDIDYGVTDIIRGSDHVTNTAVQIQIFEALSKSVPNFGHHSLLIDLDGKALSKRDGSLNLKTLKNSGIEPMAIVSLLVSLGSANVIELYKNFKDIFDTFDLSSLSKAPAKLNISSLNALSQKAVQELSINEVEDYISSIGVPKDLSRNFWDMAKENISTKNDMEELWKICKRDVELDKADPDYEFLQKAFSLLKEFNKEPEPWKLWTEKVKKVSQRKGKDLYLPLRYALTGSTSGPDMNKLLPIMLLNNLQIIE